MSVTVEHYKILNVEIICGMKKRKGGRAEANLTPSSWWNKLQIRQQFDNNKAFAKFPIGIISKTLITDLPFLVLPFIFSTVSWGRGLILSQYPQINKDHIKTDLPLYKPFILMFEFESKFQNVFQHQENYVWEIAKKKGYRYTNFY